MKGYKTSKDKKRLKELLDNGYEVICLYTYDFTRNDKNDPNYQPMMATDVCAGKLMDKGGEYERYSFSCRGTCFFDYWKHGVPYKYTFDELLDAKDIEFIEPNEYDSNEN